MRSSHALVVTGLLALLAACASNDEVQPPAALTEFRSTADIERVWSTSLGDNRPRLRLGLGVAVEGDTVFAASHGGNVDAMNSATGRRLWRTNTKVNLSAGPGAGEGLVVVGGTKGDVVALDAATGAEKWRTRINSELLAPPAVGSGAVLFRAVDGRLVALRATDGSQMWSAEEEVPRLSLRGTAQPLISGNLAISGFDNGRVMALQLNDGATVWEATVAPPSGRSELDRLVDVDSAVQVVGGGVFVVNFNGNAVRLDRDTGATVWTRSISSYAGLAVDDTGVYVVGADGQVVKFDPVTGIEVWRQDALARRRLSPPALLGSLVAVADFNASAIASNPGNFSSFALSSYVACGIRASDDALICWPYVPDDRPSGAFAAVSSNAQSSERFCGLRPTGEIVCFPDYGHPLTLDGTFTAVAGGGSSVCGVEENTRQVRCAGSHFR